MRRRVVTVNDRMQQGYSYELTAPVGRDFHPEFQPDLSPEEMLQLGVFCGKYLTDCRDEFPANWFTRAKLSPASRDCSLNYFGGTPASRCQSGARKAGFTRTIRVDGSNGIAGITWAVACPRRTPARSGGGRRSGGTSPNSESIASRAIRCAARASARRFCIGRMTAGSFETDPTAGAFEVSAF